MEQIIPTDIGAAVIEAYGLDLAQIVAAGAGDNVAINGQAFDRLASGRDLFRSAVCAVPAAAVLGVGENLAITIKAQHADDDGTGSPDTFADYVYNPDGEGDLPDTVTTIAESGGAGTFRGVARHKVDLSGAKQWIRFVATPNLSRAGTDTADVGAGIIIFGGGRELPAAI